MPECKPHLFMEMWAENVQCSTCGLVRHKIPADFLISTVELLKMMGYDTSFSFTTTNTTNDEASKVH